MKIHRSHPRERFTIIPDETLRDDRLSYHARGVLAEILSRPDDWQTTADAMWRRGRHARGTASEGRAVLRAAFTELEACGYLQRVRKRTLSGRIATEVHVYDVSAGRTDDRTAGRRSHQGKHASSQVAPTTSPPTAGPPGVGPPGVGGLVVFTETYNGDLNTKTDNEDGSLSLALAAIRAAVPDVTERETRQIIANLRNNPRVHAPVPYLTTAIRNGDAAALVAEARDQLDKDDAMRVLFARTSSSASGPRPWCGECSQITRQREDDQGRPYRCPECHWLEREAAS